MRRNSHTRTHLYFFAFHSFSLSLRLSLSVSLRVSLSRSLCLVRCFLSLFFLSNSSFSVSRSFFLSSSTCCDHYCCLRHWCTESWRRRTTKATMPLGSGGGTARERWVTARATSTAVSFYSAEEIASLSVKEIVSPIAFDALGHAVPGYVLLWLSLPA